MNGPLNRNNKFFSQEELNYYLDLAVEHLSGLNTTFLLLKVNKTESIVDDLYGENRSYEISYDEPIEIPAIIELKESSNEAYVESKGMLRYEEWGDLVLHILIRDLKSRNVEISYGDYIAYRVSPTSMAYFEVSNDNQLHYDNKKTFMGLESYFKTITAIPTSKKFDL